MKKEASSFDCFHPVKSRITYIVAIGLFFLLPLAAFGPGYFALIANDSVISLLESYQHVIRNVFFICMLLHLLEVSKYVRF